MEGRVVRSFYYRCTRYGALSKTIVVVDGRVIMPVRERRSRTGRHGEDYYVLRKSEWDRAILLHFSQTNSGYRDLVVESAVPLPQALVEELRNLWVAGATVDEVVEELLRAQRA